jgi:hypothetical protein
MVFIVPVNPAPETVTRVPFTPVTGDTAILGKTKKVTDLVSNAGVPCTFN